MGKACSKAYSESRVACDSGVGSCGVERCHRQTRCSNLTPGGNVPSLEHGQQVGGGGRGGGGKGGGEESFCIGVTFSSSQGISGHVCRPAREKMCFPCSSFRL